MKIAYHNGIIFTGTSKLLEHAVLVNDGMIEGLVKATDIPGDYIKQDLKGYNLAPSLVDLQIYGGNGRLFSHELSVEALWATAEYCLSGGAAYFMITMATNAWPKMLQAIETVRSYWKEGGKGLLGLHLEGPYINPVKRGAHLEKFIRKPVTKELHDLLMAGKGIIKMMTIAPELFSDEQLELLLNSGIIVSAGHSNATYEQGLKAFQQGIPAATHLFNAMSPFLSRAPGLTGAIYDHPDVMCSIICDGVHIDYAVVRISQKVMQERLFFITDAVTETSEGDYPHIFSGDRYILPDGTLSGSSLTMIDCVKNAVLHAGIEPDEALRMASLYPAKVLEQSFKHGLIREGYHASFVLFDEAYHIQKLKE